MAFGFWEESEGLWCKKNRHLKPPFLDKTLSAVRARSHFQALQQLGFELDAARRLAEVTAADQEGVLDPLAKRRYLRRVEVGTMRGQCHGDRVQQTGAVGGAD